MRFRLRTLMIVVTAVCMPLGWIACLRRTADSHRREFARHASNVAKPMRYSTEGTQRKIAEQCQGGSVVKWVRAANEDGDQYVLFRSTSYVWCELGAIDLSEYRSAIYHSMLADRYAKAQLRPWILISDPKPEVVYAPLSDDAWYSSARSMIEVKGE